MHRERGALFYLLSRAVPQDAIDSHDSMTRGVTAALAALGTSIEEVSATYVVEAEAIRARIGRSRFRSLDLIADAGLSNLRKIDLLKSVVTLGDLDLPKAWLGDMTETNPFNSGGTLAALSVDNIHDELYAGERWVKRFSEACFWSF